MVIVVQMIVGELRICIESISLDLINSVVYMKI